MILNGTISELEQFISWDKLCTIIKVDYYKKSMIPDDETFQFEYPPKKEIPNVKPINATFTCSRTVYVEDFIDSNREEKFTQEGFEQYAKEMLQQEIYDNIDNLDIKLYSML